MRMVVVFIIFYYVMTKIFNIININNNDHYRILYKKWENKSFIKILIYI